MNLEGSTMRVDKVALVHDSGWHLVAVGLICACGKPACPRGGLNAFISLEDARSLRDAITESLAELQRRTVSG